MPRLRCNYQPMHEYILNRFSALCRWLPWMSLWMRGFYEEMYVLLQKAIKIAVWPWIICSAQQKGSQLAAYIVKDVDVVWLPIGFEDNLGHGPKVLWASRVERQTSSARILTKPGRFRPTAITEMHSKTTVVDGTMTLGKRRLQC